MVQQKGPGHLISALHTELVTTIIKVEDELVLKAESIISNASELSLEATSLLMHSQSLANNYPSIVPFTCPMCYDELKTIFSS